MTYICYICYICNSIIESNMSIYCVCDQFTCSRNCRNIYLNKILTKDDKLINPQFWKKNSQYNKVKRSSSYELLYIDV